MKSRILKFLSLGLPLYLALRLHAQDSVTTLAGQLLVAGQTNGPTDQATFDDPAAIVTDPQGDLFIADSQNHVIREITTNGLVMVFAGRMGNSGTADGAGTNAAFNAPSGLALNPSGDLYVSDTGNNTIRKISPGGMVTTIAGIAGYPGFADGPAGMAHFSSPQGLAVAPNGALLIADCGNHCIRLLSNGIVSTFAGKPQIWGSQDGTGTNAEFNGPLGMAFDTQGNLFVSDANNDTLRMITSNAVVTTFAGSAGCDGSSDGERTNARFRSPAGLVFDQWDDLFVADSFNQTIREINTNGIVSTVSGASGEVGAANGNNGMGRFYNPFGLALARDGSLLVSDTYNELVRSVIVPFQINASSPSSSPVITLSWKTVAGKSYQAQFRNGFAEAWQNLGPALTAARASLVVTDTLANPTRIYRVVRLN